jgi:dihydroflavonol-4-reductase
MMKTTVFGATGYLGSHTAEQLIEAGHEVVAIVRKGSDCSFLQSLPVRIVRQDFDDVAVLAGEIEHGSTVLNCVADTRMHVSDDERRMVEVGLTSRLFQAAQQAQARRFVQLSTVMIYGFDRPSHAIDETYPLHPVYSYCRIAGEREDALLRLQPDSHMELVMLRPSNTLGKRDSSALPMIMQAHQKGSFAVIGGGDWRYSCMDARDTGLAMVHLMEVPVSKAEIFLACGYDTTWLEVKSALDKLLERETRLVNIPKRPAMGLAWLMERLYPYGKNPPLTRFNVEVLSNHTLFDDSKIRQTGFQPRYDLLETLCDALEKPMPG